MALEYVYYGAADLGAGELHSMLAGLLDGTVVDDITVERDGLSVASWRETPGEEARAASLFGFTHRITAIFRFQNLRRELEDQNTAVMIGCVLGILQRTGADGVLLFNGEEAVLRCVDGKAVFSDDWDWGDSAEVTAIRSGHRVARLVQPLL
ncbi:SitI3 family protein [Actinoplanes sp. KI2]|uniref:SitI3 family protein n=1 Tax=Actinoplanes sp. KI2 TaxID=2983315 RepID=UPI0021D613B5|nr:SitI3 family protein [Actinoplanes sp. KI2]MCU7722808.1 SitI3 family protein [Actinoplanes sp. KI2]